MTEDLQVLVGHNDLCLLSCNVVNGSREGANIVTADEYVANVRCGITWALFSQHSGPHPVGPFII